MGNTVSQGTQTQQSKQNMPPQKKQVENFTPVDDYRVFLNKNIKRYTANEPNILLVDQTQDSKITNRDNNQNFGSLQSVYGAEYPVYPDSYQGVKSINPGTESKKQLASPLSRIFDFVNTATTVPQHITDGQNICRSFNSLSNNVEQYYVNRFNSSNNSRCAFVYNPNYNGQPVFKGHYAYWVNDVATLQTLYDAAILDHPGTEQYFNIDRSNSPTWINNLSNVDARNAFNKFRCQIQAPKCSNISETGSPGCVWNMTSNRAVPINLSVQGTDIWYGPGYIPVSNVACSPLPPPPGTTTTPNVGACYSNGTIKNGLAMDRQCLSYILSNAQCVDQGAILTALNTNVLNENYGIPALNGASYYPGLNNIFDQTQQVEQTSNIIGQIGSNSRNTTYNSSNWAARDLCLSNGSLEDFDFCTEYNPETLPPYRLDCLQTQFRVQGGQKTGKMYPNDTTKTIYDNITNTNGVKNWGAVKDYITAMSNRTISPDIDTQAKAFNDFYGINMQQFTRQYIPVIPNIEVFWFTINSDKTITSFLGRRIQSDLTSNMANLPQTTSIQFISFFNLRPKTNNTQVKFTFNNTDGIEVIKDQNIKTTLTNDQGKIYAAWTDSAARNTGVTDPCWALNSNVNNPNYFTVAWYNTKTSPVFTQTLFQTCDASPKAVNSTDGPKMTMSQELDAPMLSFELIPDPTRNQIDFYSSDKIISHVFGDARLREVFPLNPVGSPNINTSEKFGFTNRYTSGTTLGTQTLTTNPSFMYGSVQLNSGSYYQSSNIDKGAWRTMTMLFKTGSLGEIIAGDPRYIFQYNTISVGIKNTGTVNNFFLTVGTTDTSLTGVEVLADTVYYLIIIQDSTASIGDYSYNAKFRLCVAKKSDLITDPDKPFKIDITTQTYWSETYPFTSTDYTFKIGGLNSSSAIRSVGMSVGWVRFFDYVFTSRTAATAVNTVDAQNDDLTRDLYNTWKRNWWNML